MTFSSEVKEQLTRVNTSFDLFSAKRRAYDIFIGSEGAVNQS